LLTAEETVLLETRAGFDEIVRYQIPISLVRAAR